MADDATLEQQNSAIPPESASSTPSPAQTPPESSGALDSGAQVQAQPSFLEQLSEFGDDFKGLTDEAEARNRLLEHARAVRKEREDLLAWQQQAHPYVNYGQQYVAMARDPEFQAYLAQKQAQRQQPQQVRQPQGQVQQDRWWNPPKYDPADASRYIQELVNKETGEIEKRWKPNTPAEVRAAHEAYLNYVENWQNTLSTRPHEVIPRIIAEEVGPLIEQALAQRERQRAAQMFVSDVNARNAEWLYQRDPQGNVLVDPVTREPQFTVPGARVKDWVTWLDQNGVKDPSVRWFLATSMLQNEAGGLAAQQQPAQGQKTTEQIAAEQKQAALAAGRGANAIPNRNGSRISPEVNGAPRQNKRESVGRAFVNDLKRQGVPLSAIHEAQVS